MRGRFSGAEVGGVCSGGGWPRPEVFGNACMARLARSWIGEGWCAVFCFFIIDGRGVRLKVGGMVRPRVVLFFALAVLKAQLGCVVV